MADEHSGQTKKGKKSRKIENEEAEVAVEETEPVNATEPETKPKKSKKSKAKADAQQDAQEAGEGAVETAETAGEGEKKEKKEKKRSKAEAEAKVEETAEEEEVDSPRRVGPKHDMDVAGVCASFNSCVIKAKKGAKHGCKEDIHIGRFVQAFHDLLPILRQLGTAFYFVEQDIVQKLDAITANQQKQKDTEHSRTMLNFIQWEKDNNPKMLQDKHTSARHCLRLMRALHFISLFLDKLNAPGIEPKPAAKEAYSVSLSQYHPWSVRTAVSVAFYTLPYRKSFLKHLHLDVDGANHFVDFVTATTRIRDILNLYYDANEWQNLP